MNITLCPCHSKKNYVDCCKKYHDGKKAENAQILMRSRYSAYALNLADYIMNTTHPDSPLCQQERNQWKEQILAFSQNTTFENLEVINFTEDLFSATVTFKAYLKSLDEDVTFTEKSSFEKFNNTWLYKAGKIS